MPLTLLPPPPLSRDMLLPMALSLPAAPPHPPSPRTCCCRWP